jgi:hypothetical protein
MHHSYDLLRHCHILVVYVEDEIDVAYDAENGMNEPLSQVTGYQASIFRVLGPSTVPTISTRVAPSESSWTRGLYVSISQSFWWSVTYRWLHAYADFYSISGLNQSSVFVQLERDFERVPVEANATKYLENLCHYPNVLSLVVWQCHYGTIHAYICVHREE